MPPEKCPYCDSGSFGVHSGKPATISGRRCETRYGWDRHGLVHSIMVATVRCGDCGRDVIVSAEPDWDNPLPN